jgi:hypothetical protein
MKLSIPIFFTLLLIGSAGSSYGQEVEGKGLICEYLSGPEPFADELGHLTYGFRFENGMVYGEYIVFRDDIMIIDRVNEGSYITYLDEITWWDGRWLLNRQTLILKPEIHLDLTYKCDVFNDLSGYNGAMNRKKELRQIEYDKRIDSNKI